MPGKGSRRRFEMNRADMAGMVVIAVVGLGVAFLFGMYAGRGMTERNLPSTGQVVRLPVSPAAERTPDGGSGLTFDDRRRQGEGEGAGLGGEGETAARVASGSSGRTHADPPGREGAEPRPAASATVPPSQHAEATYRPGPPQPERTPASPMARATGVPIPSPALASQGRGEWSVQVTATRDARTADGLAQQLRSKGYEAYVVKIPRADGVLYRVRVGHYESLEMANKQVSRLRREPGVPEAFVASD